MYIFFYRQVKSWNSGLQFREATHIWNTLISSQFENISLKLRYLREKYRDFTFVKQNDKVEWFFRAWKQTKPHELLPWHLYTQKTDNRALSLKYCRTLSYIIAPQALLWECPQTVAEQVHREECRRCSISGLLMLIWRALMGHLLGASCGYRKPFRGPRSGSRSLQIRPNSVRPSPVHPSASFFFRADFGSRKWNSSRRNEKKDVQKSDIALVEWSRVSNPGQDQITVWLK